MFHYFGYGSNLNLAALRAKGVEPRASQRATLRGWTLVFDVRHWFRHEGAVGNIRRAPEPGAAVQGVLHACEDAHLANLDSLEARGVAYDRIEVEVESADGPRQALTYVGLPAFLAPDGRPSRRYLNILLQGATEAGLDGAYVEWLRAHPVMPFPCHPPFEHPPGPAPVFDRHSLARHPEYTALGGAVFDMADARKHLDTLKALVGGKDMTLFHLRRHDTSDGTETLDDVREGRITSSAREYLNTYLHEYATEFRYIGRYTHD